MNRINHIALSVANLPASVAFYRDIIGLPTIPDPFKDGWHTWFSISEKAHLHLIEDRKPGESVPNKKTHFCFSTPSLEDMMATLDRAGIPFEDWPGTRGAVTRRADGIRQLWCQDPDGYWIELNDDF